MDFSFSLQNELWRKAPFLRLLPPLLIGILVQKTFSPQTLFLTLLFLVSLFLMIVCNCVSLFAMKGLEWVAGLAIHSAIFSLAGIICHLHQDVQVRQSACWSQNQRNLYLLRLVSEPVQKQNTWKCSGDLKWLVKNDTCYHENESIIIHFYKKPDPHTYMEGALIIFRKNLQPIENLKTAPEFDYTSYCHLHHIYAQVYLNENESISVPFEKKLSVPSILNCLRKKLLLIIKKYVPGASENSLLEALMVGYTDDLDPGILKSYADTGVIHVIAISGLHLALICQILYFILRKGGRKKYKQWLKWATIILSLWIYSILSGASPSVIRSAAMFTITLFARNVLRETILYNTLASSAFLLLCFDPNWIRDVGFQLSYGAVLGLGLFAKPISNFMTPKNKILKSIWAAISVSMAAQILTTPITIFYFHRFPSYFLIANLVAVPLSSGILVCGILLCIFSFIHPLGYFIGTLLNFAIALLNGFIKYISLLPGAVIPDLNINLFQLITIYLGLFCIYRFLFLKQKVWLITGLVIISLYELTHLFPIT